MNMIDFLIIFVILLFTGIGYYRGFFRVVCNLFEYILSIFLAYKFYPNFAFFLNEKFLLGDFFHDMLLNLMKNVVESNLEGQNIIIPTESLDMPIVSTMADILVMIVAIFVLFLIFKLLLKIVSFFVDKLTKLPVLKEFNKIGGLVAGLIEGVLIVFLVLAGVNLINNEAIDRKLEESLLGDTFSSVVANFTISIINKF